MVILNKQPKEQVDRVLRLPLEHDTQKSKNANDISLAITCNTAFRNLSTTLQKNFVILYLDAEVGTVFRLSPFFAYPLERTMGSSEAFHPEVLLRGDTLRVCGRFCAEHL